MTPDSLILERNTITQPSGNSSNYKKHFWYKTENAAIRVCVNIFDRIQMFENK